MRRALLSRDRRSALLSGLALGLALLGAGGCASSDPQNTFSPASDLATQIADLFSFIIWIAVGIFVVVEAVLVWAIIRFRARAGQGRPSQVHGNTPVEVAWTIAPALILAVIAVPTITTIFRTYSAPPANALQVRVIGHQWWWELQYPAQNIVTANEIHVPVGQPVSFTLNSADVIHSFWVPRLAGKRDVVPGRTNELWLTPRDVGTYDGQCAEFCGTQHANMGLKVFVDTPENFAAWVQSQQAAPALPTGAAAEGQAVFAKSACVGCHTIAGVSKGDIGPNLTHVGSRTTLAARTLDNTPENMARWVQHPQAIKPGNIMPDLGLSDAQAQALAAYLESLK